METRNRQCQRELGDIIPPGVFCGGDEIPPGTFHGGDEISSGTFHGVNG
jgi:hypothetical protein